MAKGSGKDKLSIRLRLDRHCGVGNAIPGIPPSSLPSAVQIRSRRICAFLAKDAAIACETRLALAAQAHPRWWQRYFRQSPKRIAIILTLCSALLAAGPLPAADPADNNAALGAAAVEAQAAQDAQRRAREAVLSRDSLELFPQLRGNLIAEPQQQEFGQAVGPGRFIVRIRQVTNVSGNDPWHTTQPVLNFNGVEVGDLATLIALANGAAGGGGGASGDPSDCVRSAAMLEIVPGIIWAFDFDLNPNTLDCTMPPPGTIGDGSFSIVMDNPSTPGNTTYCIGGIPGTSWNPVAGPVCVAYTPGATTNFQAKSTSGRLIEVQFRASGGNPPNAQILAITPLN